MLLARCVAINVNCSQPKIPQGHLLLPLVLWKTPPPGLLRFSELDTRRGRLQTPVACVELLHGHELPVLVVVDDQRLMIKSSCLRLKSTIYLTRPRMDCALVHGAKGRPRAWLHKETQGTRTVLERLELRRGRRIRYGICAPHRSHVTSRKTVSLHLCVRVFTS